MAAQPEQLNGGLVTARDASLLQPGELADAQNIIIQPGSTSIQKAPGRSAVTSIPVLVAGLGYANFGSEDDQLVIVGGGQYYKTPAAAPEVSPTVVAVDAGPTLDVVNIFDKAVLLSGGSLNNRVLLPNGTSRPHGLRAVKSAPGLVHATGGGAVWPLGASSVPKFYEYWTTEVYKSGNDSTADGYDEVESTFDGTTSTIQVTQADSYVTITRPPVTNNAATHWRVYRSNGKTAFFDAAFPLGFRIADVPINETTFTDGLTVSYGLQYSGSQTSRTTWPFRVPANTQITLQPWSGLLNLGADDGLNASVSGLTTTGGGGGGGGGSGSDFTMVCGVLELGNFGFVNVGSPISDIQIKVDCSRTGSATLSAILSPDGGVTFTSAKAIPFSTTPSAISGGTWGRTWSGAEFANGLFKVYLIATGPTNSGTASINIDYIQINVVHSGSTAQQVIQFPNVELIVGGEHVPVGSNGPPPRSDSGCVFQGGLLMNDLDNPTDVAWTLPGTVDYVPEPYRTSLTHLATCCRSVGNTAIVGGNGLSRFNYLPVAEDPEFNTGRAIEVLDEFEGIVSNKGAVSFIMNGKPMLFFVSQTALKLTDAFSVISATDDIYWPDLVESSKLNLCFVENNHRLREILVYYPSKGNLTVNKFLRLSYDSQHLKGPFLRVISICDYNGVVAAAAGIPNGIEPVLYTAKTATVYQENIGWADASGGSPAPRIKTREMHLAGLGESWELSKLGVHHQAGDGTLVGTVTTSVANYGEVESPEVSVTMDNRTTSIMDLSTSGEGISVTLSGPVDDLPWEIDYLVLYANRQGDADPLQQ